MDQQFRNIHLLRHSINFQQLNSHIKEAHFFLLFQLDLTPNANSFNLTCIVAIALKEEFQLFINCRIQYFLLYNILQVNMREEHFSKLEADDPSLSDHHESKLDQATSYINKRSMKRYIIVGVAFIIIFLMIVIYGVNYIRKESDQSMAELQTLKAQLKSSKGSIENEKTQTGKNTVEEDQTKKDIINIKSTLKSIEIDLKDKIKGIEGLTHQVTKKDEKIASLQKGLEKKDKEITTLKHKISQKEQEFSKAAEEKKKIKQESVTTAQNSKTSFQEQKNQNQLNTPLKAQKHQIKQESAKKKENTPKKDKVDQSKQEAVKPKENITSNVWTFNQATLRLYTETQSLEKQKTEELRKEFTKKNEKQFTGVELLNCNINLNEDQLLQSILPIKDVAITNHIDEVPFCAIVPNYANLSIHYIEYSLNSIFRQDYSKFVAVIFSSDRKEINSFIRKYLYINSIPTSKYMFVNASTSRTALENIHEAVHSHCPQNSMAMIIKGGNELLSREVFQIYNFYSIIHRMGVIYSNFFEYEQNVMIKYGGTKSLDNNEISENNFRKFEKSRFQLLAFKVQLFKQIKISDLKDINGEFFEGLLTAIALPVLQRSCGRATKIKGVYYVEHNDGSFEKGMQKQLDTFHVISKRSNYVCDDKFNKIISEKNRYPEFLERISQNKFTQKEGMIYTPNGDVSLIDIYAKNADGQRISNVIYSREYRKIRQNYHKRKLNFIANNTNLKRLHMIKYNLKHNTLLDKQQKIEQQQDYRRLDESYNFDLYKQELPFCVIIPSYNNNENQRIEYNLNTIFTQNYTNYFVVVINDASTDNSDLIYRSYLNFYNISHERYAYIENKVHKTALENTYNATYNFCSNDSVVMVVDGDDQLIGKNVLKVFNAAHQKLKGGIIYSNYYYFALDIRVTVGTSAEYPKQVKEKNDFRKCQITKYSQLRTHKAALFKSIDKSVFFDDNGEFYKITADYCTYIPMMERACGRVYFIDEFFYLYNGFTGNNDNYINYGAQIDVVYKVKRKPKLECLPEYKNIPLFV